MKEANHRGEERDSTESPGRGDLLNAADLRALFEAVFNGIQDSIAILDVRTFRILHANETFLKEYGFTLSQVTGQTCHAVTHQLDHPCEAPDHDCPIKDLNRMLSGGHADHIHFTASGEKRYVEVSCHPITESDGTVERVIHISRDITYRKEIEERLMKKSADLLKLNLNLKQKVEEETNNRLAHEELLVHQSRMASLGAMMGSLAHQWKQPMSAISLLVQDLEEAHRFGEMNEEYLTSFIESTLGQIDFMRQAVDDFRNFFKPDREKRSFPVLSALDEVQRLITPQLKNRGVRLVRHLNAASESPGEEDAKLEVFGYCNELKHVLLNLISNSMDAIEDNRQSNPGMEGEIHIFIDRDQEGIRIAIEDNGGGIPPGLVDHVFDRFFSNKKDGKGTGIGLYMSREIIQEHMLGKFYLEQPRTKDGGARFLIELPSPSGS